MTKKVRLQLEAYHDTKYEILIRRTLDDIYTSWTRETA